MQVDTQTEVHVSLKFEVKFVLRHVEISNYTHIYSNVHVTAVSSDVQTRTQVHVYLEVCVDVDVETYVDTCLWRGNCI